VAQIGRKRLDAMQIEREQPPLWPDQPIH
jgi:hypothetical protein